MRTVFKQVAELIGSSIRDLRQSIEPRLKALEDKRVDQALEEVNEEFSNLHKTNEELLAELERVKEELKARPVQDYIAKALHDTRVEVAGQLTRMNRETGDLAEKLAAQEATLKALPAAPTLDAILRNIIADLREADKELSSRCTEEARALIRQFSDELTSRVDSITEVEQQALPPIEAIAKAVAELSPQVTPVDLSGLATKAEVLELVKSITPTPVDVDAVATRAAALIPLPPSIEEVVKSATSLIAKPKDGKDGTDGKDGDSPTEAQVQALVAKEVSKLSMPTAESVAHVLSSSTFPTWALDFERRAQDVLQNVVDRMPLPQDGVDGMGFEEMTVDYDGERTFTFAMVKDARRKTFPFKVPMVIYRGIFNEAEVYDRGDLVTWAGSSWISLKDAATGKPGQSNDWQLAVKKGRDGK